MATKPAGGGRGVLKSALSGGRNDAKGVAPSAVGKASGRGGKPSRDATRNPLLSVALEPEVTCPCRVHPPRLHSATLVVVRDEEPKSADAAVPSIAEEDGREQNACDISAQLAAALEKLHTPGREASTQNAAPNATQNASAEEGSENAPGCAGSGSDAAAASEEDFVRSLAQARGDYLAAVERRAFNALKRAAMEREDSPRPPQVSPRPQSFRAASGEDGGSRLRSPTADSAKKPPLASSVSLHDRDTGDDAAASPAGGADEAARAAGRGGAAVEQLDVLFVLSGIPWSAELLAACDKQIELDCVVFLTRGSAERLHERTRGGHDLPAELRLFYKAINQARPEAMLANTIMETMTNVTNEFLQTQGWPQLAQRALQVIQHKEAFSRFLVTTKTLAFSTFAVAPAALKNSGTPQEAASDKVLNSSNLGSDLDRGGRRVGAKREDDGAVAGHEDEKKKGKKKKPAGKKEAEDDRDKSAPDPGGAHSAFADWAKAPTGAREGAHSCRPRSPVRGSDLPFLARRLALRWDLNLRTRLKLLSTSGESARVPRLYDVLFSRIAPEHHDAALFLRCLMEQVAENADADLAQSRSSSAVVAGEKPRQQVSLDPLFPPTGAGEDATASGAPAHSVVPYRDRLRRRLHGQRAQFAADESETPLTELARGLYGSARVLENRLPPEASALAAPDPRRTALRCRMYPFFPDLPPKQIDHLFLLSEFETLLKSVSPTARLSDFAESRVFYERLTAADLVDTLSQATQNGATCIAKRYVPRSDLLLLAVYHREAPGLVRWRAWASRTAAPRLDLNSFLRLLRAAEFERDSSSGGGEAESLLPAVLLELDSERHGNICGLEQTVTPHADTVISGVTFSSGTATRFPFPDLKRLQHDEEKAKKEAEQKLRRTRGRPHAHAAAAPTDAAPDLRFFPQPLHTWKSTSVACTRTGASFALRDDDVFASGCARLRAVLDSRVMHRLAQLAATPAGAGGVRSAAEREKEKSAAGASGAKTQEPEEARRLPVTRPVVEDVELAKRNLSWLETASLACFVAQFGNYERVQVAAETAEILARAARGELGLEEAMTNLQTAVTLTSATGHILQVMPDGSIWQSNDAALWNALKRDYGDLFDSCAASEALDVPVFCEPGVASASLKSAWSSPASLVFFGCQEDFELQRRIFPDGRVLRLLISGRTELLFPDGTVASRNPTHTEFRQRLASTERPPARHLASLLGVFLAADLRSLDAESSPSPQRVAEVFANGRTDQGLPGHWLFTHPDGSRCGCFKPPREDETPQEGSRGPGGSFTPSQLPCERGLRSFEGGASAACLSELKLDAALARSAETQALGGDWRAYALPPVAQASYPGFHSSAQVVLNGDSAMRVECLPPKKGCSGWNEKRQRFVAHPDGTRVRVEEGTDRHALEIEKDAFCRFRISRCPVEADGEPRVQMGNSATACEPPAWRTKVFLQTAQGSAIAISCFVPGSVSELDASLRRATRVAVHSKEGWRIFSGAGDEIEIEWSDTACLSGLLPGDERDSGRTATATAKRKFSCSLRRKELVTATNAGIVYIVRSNGDLAVKGGATEGDEACTLAPPAPGFASPLYVSALAHANYSAEETGEAEPNAEASLLGGLRLFAVCCHTGEADEILSKLEVQRHLDACGLDQKSVTAPVRVLQHPFEGCRSFATFTAASSAAPSLPLSPLPVETAAGSSPFREPPATAEATFTVFRSFLEYPATTAENWRVFKARCLEYLQWEAIKAPHNLPFLVSPDVAELVRSTAESSGSIRVGRWQSLRAAKGSRSLDSAPSRVPRLSPSLLSVQALELQSLRCRAQTHSLRRTADAVAEALDDLRRDFVDTQLDCRRPTAEAGSDSLPIEDPDAGAAAGGPGESSEAALACTAQVASQSQSGTSDALPGRPADLLKQPPLHAADTFPVEPHEAAGERAIEAGESRIPPPWELPPRLRLHARLIRGEAKDDFDANASRRDETASGNAPDELGTEAQAVSRARSRGKPRREAAIDVQRALRSATPQRDADLPSASSRSSSGPVSPSRQAASRGGDTAFEATPAARSGLRTRAAGARGLRCTARHEGTDSEAAAAEGRVRAAAEGEGISEASERTRRSDRCERESQIYAAPPGAHAKAAQKGNTQRVPLNTKGKGDGDRRSSLYDVYGKPRRSDAFCFRNRFTTQVTVARKDRVASSDFVCNEKYQLIEAPVDRRLRTASLARKCRREGTANATTELLLDVFPRSLDFGRCVRAGEVSSRVVHVRNLDSDVCRFSVFLERDADDSGYEIRLLYTAGPVAPGLSLEIIAELVAFRPASISAAILVTHKAHILRIPVVAQAV
ncbi:hypothetical protein BESB_020650 [Besnoitia besnoiti]|uniref:Uncharacterized protein n=1 Tax=Besnoitia besnoiti TaxID=94643 RepID=A0A2A9M4H5_BESBE|nr:hypothetical protein BESB_020650 [Besnoitia besnoiti]PFH32124.1 hypothetical protein BESB_020650 [Besnoitia besnoiti]